MGRVTSIKWAHGTYNPWRGCEKVSEGCAHCYAEDQATRNPMVLGSWGKDRRRVVAADTYWNLPRLLNQDAHREGTRKRLFTLSFGDFFDQYDGPLNNHQARQLFTAGDGLWAPDPRRGIPLCLDDVRERVLTQIANTQLLDWLILTKRAESILPTLERIAKHHPESPGVALAKRWVAGNPPDNVWLGASVENQKRAASQITALKDVPATVRFLSVEPMLAEIDVTPWLDPLNERTGGFSFYRHHPDCDQTCLQSCIPAHDIACVPDPDPFHWVIIGGESGNHARPFPLDAARELKEQLQRHGVPVFFKQLGAKPLAADPADQVILLKVRHDKGEDIWEFPPDLQVQEFPNTEE